VTIEPKTFTAALALLRRAEEQIRGRAIDAAAGGAPSTMMSFHEYSSGIAVALKVFRTSMNGSSSPDQGISAKSGIRRATTSPTREGWFEEIVVVHAGLVGTLDVQVPRGQVSAVHRRAVQVQPPFSWEIEMPAIFMNAGVWFSMTTLASLGAIQVPLPVSWSPRTSILPALA